MESPFSVAGARQQAARPGGATPSYDPSPTDPFRRRYGGDTPAAAAGGGSSSSVPSVASAPSLLQSGSRLRDHSLHAQHRGLASPTWSDDRGIGGGGGGEGPREQWTPGRKRPRTQVDRHPASPPLEGLAGGGSLDADRVGRPSTMPRKLGECSALVKLPVLAPVEAVVIPSAVQTVEKLLCSAG